MKTIRSVASRDCQSPFVIAISSIYGRMATNALALAAALRIFNGADQRPSRCKDGHR